MDPWDLLRSTIAVHLTLKVPRVVYVIMARKHLPTEGDDAVARITDGIVNELRDHGWKIEPPEKGPGHSIGR